MQILPEKAAKEYSDKFMKLIEVHDLKIKYGDMQIVKDVDFCVEEGQWLMIAGPNGAGKSTILNAISRGVSYEGQICYQGQDIKKMKGTELARHIGILSQNHMVGYGFTVKEVVGLGRYAYRQGILKGDNSQSREAVQKAIRAAGLQKMADKSVLQLSGGELQRTFLAQLFAQEPDVMILDEPANHLDLVYQKQVFELITDWVREPGRAVISVVHDLSLAKAYGTHCLLLNHGAVAALGEIDEVLKPSKLDDVYQMDVCGWMRKMLGQWTE